MVNVPRLVGYAVVGTVGLLSYNAYSKPTEEDGLGGGLNRVFEGLGNYTGISKLTDPETAPTNEAPIINFPVNDSLTSSVAEVTATKKLNNLAPASTSFGVGLFDSANNLVGGYDFIQRASFVGDTPPSKKYANSSGRSSNSNDGSSKKSIQEILNLSNTKKNSSSSAYPIGSSVDGGVIYSDGSTRYNASMNTNNSSSSSSSSSSSTTKKKLKVGESRREKVNGRYVTTKRIR